MSYNRGVPYRINALPEPEPAEVEDPYARVLRAQRRRARLVSVLVVIGAAGGVVKVARSSQPPPRRVITEATRTDGARAAIAGARARAASAQARFEAGMREALAAKVVARADLGACPFALPAGSLASGRAAFPLLTIEQSDASGTLPSQAVAGVLADVHRAEAHLAAGRFEEAQLYARALDRPERFGYDVVLVASTRKRPRALSGNEFEPGDIEGRAYVYDFASGRVVCAGDVKAKSSKEIGYVFSDRTDTPAWLGPVASMSDAISEDMRLQTERAIVAAVQFRAGPPL